MQLSHRDRKQNSGCQAVGEEERGSYCLTGVEFQLCKMKSILEKDGDDGCTISMVLNVHVKRGKTVNFMLCVFYHNKKWGKKLKN